jgi:transposase
MMVNASAPIFVIADGHPTHKAKMVERYVAGQDGRLAQFVLPPYSPELNPDEFVWSGLKAHGTGRKLITSPTQLQKTVMAHLRQLQGLPQMVRSFFQAPYTRYARF